MDIFAKRMKAVLDRSHGDDPESSITMQADDLCTLVDRSRTEDVGLQRAANCLRGSKQPAIVRMVQFREMVNAVLGVDPAAEQPANESTDDQA